MVPIEVVKCGWICWIVRWRGWDIENIRDNFKIFLPEQLEEWSLQIMEKTRGGTDLEEEDRNSFWTYLRCLSDT